MITFQDMMNYTHEQMQLKRAADRQTEARTKRRAQLNQELDRLCDYHRAPSRATVRRLQEIREHSEFPDLARHAANTLKWMTPLLENMESAQVTP